MLLKPCLKMIRATGFRWARNPLAPEGELMISFIYSAPLLVFSPTTEVQQAIIEKRLIHPGVVGIKPIMSSIIHSPHVVGENTNNGVKITLYEVEIYFYRL